jgi:hypothetical protein
MMIREYFAAMVMQALIAKSASEVEPQGSPLRVVGTSASREERVARPVTSYARDAIRGSDSNGEKSNDLYRYVCSVYCLPVQPDAGLTPDWFADDVPAPGRLHP